MPIQLTNLPLSWSAEPQLVDYGGDQATAMGSAQARFVRLGTRWAVKFGSLPSLSWASYKPLLAARLAAIAAGETVITSWPQPAFTASIGAPAVAGAGQGGGSLVVSGLAPGVTLQAGLFFSTLDAAGRNYLYQLAAGVTADGSGNATLGATPWLRQPPANGAALNFSAPQIEGLMESGASWTLSMQAWVTLPEFTITELQ